ncbi:MAG: TonB-dependent receptor [Chitinophagaceae bacterium]|nr:TonB-dependent receptor [Chitinophagaceae bacterium]
MMKKKPGRPQRSLRTGISLLVLFSFLFGPWPPERLSAQVSNLKGEISFSAEKITIADVITGIQQQTTYVFSYDKVRLSTVYVQHIAWVRTPLGKALEELQNKAHLRYTLLDNNIAITVVKAAPVRETAPTRAPGTATLKGRIVDFETSQPLPGATVSLSGKGTQLTDDRGFYAFMHLPDSVYTLTVTYAGYQENKLAGIRIRGDKERTIDIKMQVSALLNTFVIASGAHKIKSVTHSTERQLIQEIRTATGVVSGISNELINKTADRNAAEVVKRISGVTVVDNRFIVVRGMNERYNLTYLNDNIAPSTELYSKAFAYDLLPSSIIDKILVYKSPRPDLSGEYAGAAVKIYTRNAVPVKHIDIGLQLAHRPGSTMTDINSYKGSKWDWLGVDDGARKLPGFSPGYFQSNHSAGNISQADMVKSFSPTLTYGRAHSLPDIQAFFNYYDSYQLGKEVRLYDLTSVTYTGETTFYDVYRQSGNTDAFIADGGDLNLGTQNLVTTSRQSTEIGKINVLENLTLRINRRNTLQLKNFFVNDGRKFTGINDIRANVIPRYDSSNFSNNRKKDIVLSFQQRLLYSGNLGGTHTLGRRLRQDLEWNLGYTYDLQNVPDQRISHFQTAFVNVNYPYESHDLVYTAAGSNMGDYNSGFLGMISRLFVKNNEHIYNGSADYTIHLSPGLQVKAGTFQLFKTRDVGRRFFRVNRGGLAPDEVMMPANQGSGDGWSQGYGLSNPSLIYFHLQDLDKTWNPAWFPEDNSGLKIYDATTPVDAYVATEQNNAGYVMGDWKTAGEKLTLNGGLRVEYDRQKLAGANASANGGFSVVYVDHPKTSVLPSVNLTYRPDSLFVIRAGYGRTVNRPEFRELTPYNDFDFINNEVIIGNPKVVTATIDNYDLRAEFYPPGFAQNEVFNMGVFYKYLQDPIERLRTERSGYIDVSSFTAINFANAKSAEVYGLEAEIKKSLSFLGGGLFRRLSVVLNGTLVKSKTKQYTGGVPGAASDTVVVQGRPLQGQAPYVFNGGLFYEDPGMGTKVGVTYNVSGPIIYAKSLGTPDYRNSTDSAYQLSIRPDLLQLPMHLLDVSVTQRIVKSLKLKFSIQNLLDQSYRIVEDHNYNQRYDPEYPVKDNLGQTYYKGDNIYTRYKPGRYFLLSFTYAF